MKTKKVFIPRGAIACSMHQSINNWNINAMKRWNKFNPEKIKQMIDLLCDVKQKSMVPIVPGNIFAEIWNLKKIFRRKRIFCQRLNL